MQQSGKRWISSWERRVQTMNIKENLSMALSSIRGNKMRALLTMLGIIIGISSVITIMTLGDSLAAFVNDSMQGVGAQNITVYLKEKKAKEEEAIVAIDTDATDEGHVDSSATLYSDENLITDYMLTDVKEYFKGDIDYINVTDEVGTGKVSIGRSSQNIKLTGVTPEYSDVNSLDISDGRFLHNMDVRDKKKVAVISDKMAKKVFKNESPLGKQITAVTDIDSSTYIVVGVYEIKKEMVSVGASSGDDSTHNIFIPLSVANAMSGANGSGMLDIVAAPGSDSRALADEIKDYMNNVFYSQNRDYEIDTFSMETILKEAENSITAIKTAVSAIAAISLLVGGIGVMNIMLVSVTERTREIGIRKSLGATNREIKLQFVIEAIIMCLIGGFIGILLGIPMGVGGSALAGKLVGVSLSSILIATGFALGIGLFFGFYPASKAAKLNPIDALRYE